MNYQKIYNRLIKLRQQHPATGYTEKHHILPRSMGGSDEAANLVVLTGREHWVAHLLLWKIHRNSQTVHACHMMAMRCKVRGIPKVRSSRMYETLRIEHAKLVSKRLKITHRGECNSQYGTRWICNLELQQNKKISKDDEIPDGWIVGRNRWKIEEKYIVISDLKNKKNIKLKSKSDLPKNCRYGKNKWLKKEEIKILWEEFINSDVVSVNIFSKIKNIPRQTIQSWFEKYIEAYKINRMVRKPIKTIIQSH